MEIVVYSDQISPSHFMFIFFDLIHFGVLKIIIIHLFN